MSSQIESRKLWMKTIFQFSWNSEYKDFPEQTFEEQVVSVVRVSVIFLPSPELSEE